MMTPLFVAALSLVSLAQEVFEPARGSVAHHFRPEDYPTGAAARGAQGSVDVRLNVAPDGRIVGCSVTRSSGHEDLDRRACSVLLQRAKVEPARDRSGRRVADTMDTRITWRLADPEPEPMLARFERFREVTTISLAADGSIRCRVETHAQAAIDVPDDLCRATLPEGAARRIPAGGRGEVAIVTTLTPSGTEPLASQPPGFGAPAGDVEAEIVLAADGSMSACRVTAASGPVLPESDYCETLAQGRLPIFEPAGDGRPRIARLRVTAYARLLSPT